MLKVIVAGGRDFDQPGFMYEKLDDLFCRADEYGMPERPLMIVHGRARGADCLAGEWAVTNWCRVKEFPADWETHGKAAGMIRNREMAKFADVLVAFWDGQSRGTKNMIDEALKRGLDVHVYRYTPLTKKETQ